jgi:hypothetical protein
MLPGQYAVGLNDQEDGQYEKQHCEYDKQIVAGSRICLNQEKESRQRLS